MSEALSTRTGEPLAWRGRILRELIRLAVPMWLGMASINLKTLADTWFVGRLGPAELAGVGLGGTLVFVLVCFPIGLLDGVRVLASQAAGAGDRSRVLAYVRVGAVLALVLGAVAMGCAFAASFAIPMLAGSAAAGSAARVYFEIRLLEAPLLLLMTAIKDGRHAIGDARSPMIAAIAGNVLNVVFDYVLIFIFDLGVAGAAWGTVAAVAIELAILIAVQLREGFGPLSIARADVAAMWRLGVPIGIHSVLGIGAFSVMTLMIAGMGEAEMAGNQIALRLTHLTFLPVLALGGAVAVLCGQASGAGQPRLVRAVARIAQRAQLAYAGIVGVVYVLSAESLARFFTADAATLAVATLLVRISVLWQLGDGAYTLSRSALQGTGDVRYPAVAGVIIGWCLTPPLTFLLGSVAGLGAAGGWLGLCAEMFAGATLMWLRLSKQIRAE